MGPSPWRALICFALIGAGLFVLVRLPARVGWSPPSRARPIAVRPEERVAVAAAEAQRLGRPPTDAELEAIVAAHLDDEILLHEARLLGLDRGDRVIHDRLVRNMRFLGEAEADSADLHARAVALGMSDSDVVVRRRLIQQMRALLEAPARARVPGDTELGVYLAVHPERFGIPRRVAFDHVFFDAARRGDADADARAALARLASGADPAAEAGDPFLAPRHQPLASEVSLARYFGPEFASALFGLAAGRWSGPLASIGGVHLVRIERHEPARVPTLEEVRPQVRDALLTEEAEAAVRRFLELRRTP